MGSLVPNSQPLRQPPSVDVSCVDRGGSVDAKFLAWSDEDVKRFLRARQGSVRETTTNIQETLVWRKKYDVDRVRR